LQLRQRNTIKWSKGESIQSFEWFFNYDLTFDTMLQHIKEMVQKLPNHIGNIIKFACVIGLRTSEVVESVIDDKEAFQTYYKHERNTEEHYRFSSIFLRQTKKVYISLVSPEIIDVSKAAGICNVAYNAIRLACWKRGITCDMRFCRKVFASYLRQCGIESEIVDLLLQGRVPRWSLQDIILLQV
jgi:hypothetical protein